MCVLHGIRVIFVEMPDPSAQDPSVEHRDKGLARLVYGVFFFLSMLLILAIAFAVVSTR